MTRFKSIAALAAGFILIALTAACGGGGDSGGSSAPVEKPAISTQPAPVSVNAGASASFSVSPSGTAPFSYQWQKNGADIAGATSSSYTTPPISAA
ncbi:MAG: immunoglobulin domain-containing protein, partial [Rhodoferax sp.]|nr:immunoglobulin domain-containing protein [Rhodoferax sp.]